MKTFVLRCKDDKISVPDMERIVKNLIVLDQSENMFLVKGSEELVFEIIKPMQNWTFCESGA